MELILLKETLFKNWISIFIVIISKNFFSGVKFSYELSFKEQSNESEDERGRESEEEEEEGEEEEEEEEEKDSDRVCYEPFTTKIIPQLTNLKSLKVSFETYI